MPPSSKTQRWLDLIAFLAVRRMPVAVEEIMEHVPSYAGDWRGGDETARASVRRKFERDKDELRELGIPIETVEYRINYGLEQTQGYRLRGRDFYLPYLRLVSGDEERGGPQAGASASGPDFELRPDEARAAVDALRRVGDLPSFPFRDEARSALRKLTFDLGPEVVREGAAGPPVRYLPPPGADDVRDRLKALSDALLRRKEVRFGYYGIHRDERSERRVHPYGLLFQDSHWYLVAWDLDREAMRVFRVARMDAPDVNPRKARTPDYEVPDDFDLDDYAGRPPWSLPGQDDEPLVVDVRFAFPRSLWAERNRHGELVEELEGGAHLRRFRVQDRGPFLRWILALGDEAAVVAPGALADELAAMGRRIADLHREEHG